MRRLTFILLSGLFLIGCSDERIETSEDSWEESPTLIREGKQANFTFRIGDNGNLGFVKYGPFVEGKEQKYMWHFWGKIHLLNLLK